MLGFNPASSRLFVILRLPKHFFLNYDRIQESSYNGSAENMEKVERYLGLFARYCSRINKSQVH